MKEAMSHMNPEEQQQMNSILKSAGLGRRRSSLQSQNAVI